MFEYECDIDNKNVNSKENELFSFEFHSLIITTECKSISDTLKFPCLRMFGRTRNYQSICVNVLNVCPYFFVNYEDTLETVPELPFGSVETLASIGINYSTSIRTNLVTRIPFYNFYNGTQKFIKIECCSESVRKKLVEYLKNCTESKIVYTLYEAHISSTLQFMSDFGIVGMGLVYFTKYHVVLNDEKSSNCDLEYTISAEDILNPDMIKSTNSSNSLLPSLSIFLDALGLTKLNPSEPSPVYFESEYLNPFESIKSIHSLWPIPGRVLPPYQEKLKCPTFRKFMFRQQPPLQVTNYTPISIPKSSHTNTTTFSNVQKIGVRHYTPAIDPPRWNRNLQKLSASSKLNSEYVSKNEISKNLEKLTLPSIPSSNNTQLYDLNGDFFLKFMVLECYESTTLLSGASMISTLIFSIFANHKNQVTSIFTTNLSKSIPSTLINNLTSFDSELEMIESFVNVVVREDPDVLVGHEVDNKSWGLLAERFSELSSDPSEKKPSFSRCISRIRSHKNLSSFSLDPWLARVSSNFQTPGRIVFNLWRIYKEEVALRSYSIGSLCDHYFNTSVPEFSSQELYEMIVNDPFSFLRHIKNVSDHVVKLTINTSYLVKAIEYSRLFGIDLFSTLTRGSQYRVESILIRAAHSENYLLRSTSEVEVREMRAAQGLPLVFEPLSGFYEDPVVVVDFQSLYPSMIIGYNFCYSTIIGTVKNNNQIASCGVNNNPSLDAFKLNTFEDLKEEFDIFSAPGDILFLQKSSKDGLIPRLLNEILTTRIAIKNAMKICDPKLKNILDARQMALKYISNLTYGYTSASFSGRMPNVDVADAIVLSGRKTLEKAIDVIESHPTWEAKVIYGDTDSLFILLPGRSRTAAFRIGRAIANEITSRNPSPVALKFEKVYHPCVLMSKKRYCGYKYESEESAPVLDDKGIETVRRDGCMLTSKILEKSLRLLFTGTDVSMIKSYVQRQVVKILSYQKVNVSDFIFSREVRFGSYRSDENNRLPLSAIAGKMRQARNGKDVIAYGQRVPFVIIHKPFSKLYQQVVDIETFLTIKSMKLDVLYYVTKQILPVLARNLLVDGIDVWEWYRELPLTQLRNIFNPKSGSIFYRLGGKFISKTEHQSQHNSTCRKKLLEEALKLQDFNIEDCNTFRAKVKCCGKISCRSLSCQVFWERFNFEHLHLDELQNLRQFFDLQ